MYMRYIYIYIYTDGTIRLSFDQSRFRRPLDYDESRFRSLIHLHQPNRQSTILLNHRPVS